MSEFVWQDQYLIGNPTVDQQHQQLFNLANKLVESKNRDDLLKNAMYLYRHIREHFQAEEAFMKKLGYPDYQQHVEIHNLMLDRMTAISAKINRDEWQPQDVKIFMKEWIAHITEEDKAIGAYGSKQA